MSRRASRSTTARDHRRPTRPDGRRAARRRAPPATRQGGRRGALRRAADGIGRRGRRLLLLVLLGALLAYPGAFLADAVLAALFG